jgi:hypothetical protein
MNCIKKHISKIIVTAMIGTIILVLYYFNFAKPIKIQDVTIKIEEINSANTTIEDFEEDYLEVCAGEPEWCIPLRLNEKFPGGELSDYRRITVEGTVKNRSMFHQRDFIGLFTASENNRMLYEWSFKTKVERFQKLKVELSGVYMYTAGMTDEEITAYILEQDMVVQYENEEGRMKKTKVSLK